MPPTPTPTPTPPPPPTPPPTTYYPHSGTDCTGVAITIYTANTIFNAGDNAYANSGGTLSYNGYFIYGGTVISYTGGTGTTVTSYSHTVEACAGGSITIYTSSASFSVNDAACTNPCLNASFNGAIISNGNNYKYSNGVASQTYAYVGTNCNGNSVTIYTQVPEFTITTSFSDQCLTATYSGFFIYSGSVYYYSDGNGSAYSYAHVGTDCSGNTVTIYTTNATFSYSDIASSNQCLSANYTGYFIYSGITISYSNGNGSPSSCSPPPTPPPPTPTPPPTPMPSYTDPNILKADLHASYETGLGTWQNYRVNVTGLFAANSGTNQSDYRDHLIREFNRKISILNQPTGLFIRPFDDGFRFTGVSIQ